MQELPVLPGAPKQADPPVLARLGGAANLLSDISGGLAGYLMLFAAFLVTYDALTRSLFDKPVIWAFEITCYIFIWYGFLTAPSGMKMGSHINVDILVSRMKDRTRIPLETIAYAVTLVYAVMLTYYVYETTWRSFSTNEISPTILHVPVWIIDVGVLVGCFILALQTFYELGRKIAVLARGGLETGRGILNKPALVLPVYLLLCACGIYLYADSPGIGIIVTVLAMLLGGIPVFTTLGTVGAIGLFLLLGTDTGLPQTAFVALKALDNFTLLAIPMYIIVGQVLVSGGIAKELYEVCTKWLGHLPGGLAVATVVACGIFAAISGSSVATAAAIGLVALPEMLKRGYEPKLAYGLLAAGGTLGILIPPSGAMIIYSSITDESTGALFIGGIVPGILFVLAFSVFASLYCLRTGQYEKEKTASWKDRLISLKEGGWGLLTPFIIIVSIYTGLCTPTEAAAIAIVYAVVVSLARGKIRPRQLTPIMIESNKSSSMILMIIVGSLLLGAITTLLEVPQQVVAYIGALEVPRVLILVCIFIVYLILGMFLEVVSILLITIPIVYPLITSLGYSGLWFGVWVTVLMEVALITPPVGLNIYVIQGIGKASMADVCRGVIPFLVMLLAGILLLAIFPEMVLWLPGTVR
jgi:C4-dicarboxylate transporter DctM subunit